MNGSAIGMCGNDGCLLAFKNPSAISTESDDPLVTKFIKSKFDTSNFQRKCEAKSPSENFNYAIVVYGNTDERKKMFSAIKDEMRTFWFSIQSQISIGFLCERVGNAVRNFHLKYVNPQCEIILATWTAEEGAQMYCIESSGDYYKCFACAIGDNKDILKRHLKNYGNFTVKSLFDESINVFSAVDEDFDRNDVNFTWIGSETNGKHQKCSSQMMDGIFSDFDDE